MALSLRQGQWLALIGLLASFATPLLIQAETPSLTGLYGYLLIIGAAALVLSRWKIWGWLSLGVVAGWLGWSAFSLRTEFSMPNQMIWLGFLGIGFVTTVFLASRYKAGEFVVETPNKWKVTPGLAMIWGMIAAGLAIPFLTDFVGEVRNEGIVKGPDANIQTPSLLDYIQIFGVIGLIVVSGLIFRRQAGHKIVACLLYTSPSPRDLSTSRMPSSA